MAVEKYETMTGCLGLTYNVDIDRLRDLSYFLRNDEGVLEKISLLPDYAIYICQQLIEEEYGLLNYQYCEDMERVFGLCEFYKNKILSVSSVSQEIEKYSDILRGTPKKIGTQNQRDENGVLHREYLPTRKMMVGGIRVDE